MHRGEIDDAATTALLHAWDAAPGSQKEPAQIDGDDPIPFVVTGVHQQLIAGNSGVVDQDIDAAECANGLVDQPVHVGCEGNIAVDKSGIPASCGHHLSNLCSARIVDVGNRDVCTGSCEALGDGAADALGRARYNSDLPGKWFHARFSVSGST